VRKKVIFRRFFLFPVLLTVFIFSGCTEKKDDYPARKMPEGISKNENQLNRGKSLFMNKCASCHGKPSEGRSDRASFFQPPAPDFTDAHYRRMDPAYLYWRIDVVKTVEPFRSQGSVMPAWGLYFSEQQIWQIVAYLQARAH
jgi:mono/diheme cytochrome c family protein